MRRSDAPGAGDAGGRTSEYANTRLVRPLRPPESVTLASELAECRRPKQGDRFLTRGGEPLVPDSCSLLYGR
jgi:hypothetical protein